MSNINFHKNFKLNGFSFSSEEELLKYAKQIDVPIHQFLSDWFSSEDRISVQTSGSTGTPKQIQLKKDFMKNSAKATGEFFKLKENTTALLCLSVNYIAGKMMLVRALTLGWNLDIVTPNSNIRINKQYDFSAMVPMQLRNSLSEIHKIKKLIVGGGVVANDLIEKIQNLPTKIYATYGMTETITHIAVKKLNNPAHLQEKLICNEFFKTLPNVKIYIDQRNCLIIKAKKLSDELIVTNDVVQLISDTQFQWLGRVDNVINSGGIKLYPERIEEKLSKVIKSRFFVAGIKDAVLEKKLILVIESKEKLNIDFNKINGLTKYEIPKETYCVDEFIETETKKIQRQKTLELKIVPFFRKLIIC